MSLCIICAKKSENTPFLCTHAFHDTCITKWKEHISRGCPLCKIVRTVNIEDFEEFSHDMVNAISNYKMEE